jgi:hypothetical protein
MNHKLSPEEVEEIMIELRAGTSANKIASGFGISSCMIRQINNGQVDCYRIDGVTYPIVRDARYPPVTEKLEPVHSCPPGFEIDLA